jgi:pimeloyl-ACP methyl ester carboxylesterase
MHIISEATNDGVEERLFSLDVTGERVPGVLWTPAGASGTRPLVLMGHGGSQHKKVDTLVARARRYVKHLGFAVAAIDAPGHGERVSAEEAARFTEAIRQRIAEGRRAGAEPDVDRITRIAHAVPEWHATLDALQKLDVVGSEGPVGYWGVSMGTAIGVPFVASEPRILAAVFGLAGLWSNSQAMADAAGRITIPIEFALQSDDEIVTREAGLALFDAFGSTEKTMHLNPGGHLGIPMFERDSWERFYVRHLVDRTVART